MTIQSSINNKSKDYSTMYSNIEESNSGKSLSFDINGLNASIVNGLRRTILNDIVDLGFRYESGEKSIKVNTVKAEGQKCPVCWKINKNGCERHSSSNKN